MVPLRFANGGISLVLTYTLLFNMVDFTYCCLKIWGAYAGSPEKQLYRVDVEDIR